MGNPWTLADIPSQAGKRILITGANSGIGYHAAFTLARKGAHVILACRDRRKGEAAFARLDSEAPGTGTELALLDLASLASVREFAARQLDLGHPIDILINNAGVMAPPTRQQTVDGFELQFGTNVLGHFALTGLLLPLLQKAVAEAPRIVTIASIAHKRGRLNFDDLQYKQNYAPMKTYQQSKLANLMLALEMERRLRASGSTILSVAAHPGIANTNLFQTGHHSAVENAVRRVMGHLIGAFLNTEAEGALPTLYAATSSAVTGGDYYGPQGFQEMSGEEIGPAKIMPQANDTAAAARLWDVCEELSGVKFL
ncbi:MULTISPECIES: oxidoreductase [Acidobacteriaceae]|uniref:oxidoreductase n=1 Tax=Acidobacteriaceae TaxID=204434 RepID=UPI00131B11A0|nr:MULTISPECIES: oxidoreductase [Acidobacteriaceae]MDW5267223.1 oxidoreductase [Edaphobacter sp.]